MGVMEEFENLLSLATPDERRMLLTLLRQKTTLHPLEKDWSVTAEVVLEAIQRSSELTQRMFRGILAEAAFKVEVVDRLDDWEPMKVPSSAPFDFQLRNGDRVFTIQVKLQRKLGGVPMRSDQSGFKDSDKYVVEMQKTRGGRDSQGQSTRPYRFGEFDILAVSVEPVTSNWTSFRYTCARWLIPRPEDPSLIAIFQPVSIHPDDDWTDDLRKCIEWHYSDRVKTIEGERLPRGKRRSNAPRGLDVDDSGASGVEK